jgi:hypothetical protein
MRVELVKSELCTKFNFDMTCVDFIDFLNKPEQVELLKSVSKNKIYVEIKLVSKKCYFIYNICNFSNIYFCKKIFFKSI